MDPADVVVAALAVLEVLAAEGLEGLHRARKGLHLERLLARVAQELQAVDREALVGREVADQVVAVWNWIRSWDSTTTPSRCVASCWPSPA